MADTLDLLTLDEAKDALSVGALDTGRDDIIARLVTTLSRKLDKAIGPTVMRSVTTERHNGGRHAIELAWTPVHTITEVVEYQGGSVVSAVTLSECTLGVEPSEAWWGDRYEPDPRLYSGLIYRRMSGGDACWWQGRGNVAITYTAGRSESTGAVDARIKEAGAIMLRNYWRSYESTILTGVEGEYDMPAQSFPSFAVPKVVKGLLHEMWQPDVGFGG